MKFGGPAPKLTQISIGEANSAGEVDKERMRNDDDLFFEAAVFSVFRDELSYIFEKPLGLAVLKPHIKSEFSSHDIYEFETETEYVLHCKPSAQYLSVYFLRSSNK